MVPGFRQRAFCVLIAVVSCLLLLAPLIERQRLTAQLLALPWTQRVELAVLKLSTHHRRRQRRHVSADDLLHRLGDVLRAVRHDFAVAGVLRCRAPLRRGTTPRCRAALIYLVRSNRKSPRAEPQTGQARISRRKNRNLRALVDVGALATDYARTKLEVSSYAGTSSIVREVVFLRQRLIWRHEGKHQCPTTPAFNP